MQDSFTIETPDQRTASAAPTSALGLRLPNGKGLMKDGVMLFTILALMFGFRLIPPFGEITETGMAIMGVFLGLIVGWSAWKLAETSLLGIFALWTTGYMTFPEIIGGVFGNTTIVFVLFLFMLVGVVDRLGLPQLAASWLMSRKALLTRPWLAAYILFVAASLVSVLTNTLVVVFTFWQLIYKISDAIGYKKFDKWPTFMIVGVTLGALTGSPLLPFKAISFVFLDILRTSTGEEIAFAPYIIIAIVLMLTLLAGYIAVGKFFYRVDVSKWKAVAEMDNATSKMAGSMKATLCIVGLWLAALILPSLFPSLTISQAMLPLGPTGPTILALLLLRLVRHEGKPLFQFQDVASKSVQWPIIIMLGILLLMVQVLTADGTGIQPTIGGALQPLFFSTNPFVVIVVLAGTAYLLSNFMSNAVVGALVISAAYPVSVSMGFDITAAVVIVCFTAQIVLLTPAATPVAGIMLANEWINVKKAAPLIFATFVMIGVVILTLGTALAAIMY